VAMMLGWIGENRQAPAFSKAGEAMEKAVDEVLANPETRTRDLGGSIGCKAFGEHVARAVSAA
jgi:3-isopropylmalate dehydrogenase